LSLSAEKVIEMFEASGGFLRGHFALTSGAHSSGYVQSSQILGRPEYTEPIAAELASRFRDEGATCVVGPALGGAILAYAVGRLLGVRVVYAERIQGILSLARGYQIASDDRVLIVEDVLITGRTIEETIEKVEELLAEDLITIASPNILTYHPSTEITRLHQKEKELDYHSSNLDNRPPYTYFEEAFPAVVSKNLSEEQIWHIHEQTRERWGVKRNLNPMAPIALPLLKKPLDVSNT